MTLAGEWIELESVDSTQIYASQALLEGQSVAVVFAHDQTRGRGRLGREWRSLLGESLTMSLVFTECPNLSKPWLLGMAVAVSVADVMDCQVQWPNDLVLAGKKVGGVLTEMTQVVGTGAIPIVGIGLNLNQREPYEDLGFATSFFAERRRRYEPTLIAHRIVESIRSTTLPTTWADLADKWIARDTTPGKHFKTPGGDIVVADSIGKEGELIARLGEKIVTVYAADAWFGTDP